MSTLPVRLRSLFSLGVLGALLYVLVSVIFWTEAMTHRTWMVQAAVFASVSVLAILYFIGIRYVRETSVWTIVAFAGLFAFVGFLTVPFDSTDVIYYIAQGWEQSHYSSNPYSHVLRDIPNGLQDPMIGARWMSLNRNPWLDEPLPYGFGFALVIRTIAWLGNGDWWRTLALFNLLNLSIHAAVMLLLWKTAKLVGVVEPKLVLYLYAWSPLVVLQYLANVHNDLIMAALIVLAFYLLQKRGAWVLPVLVAAGFVKYVAFALVPFALIRVYRRHGWKAAANGVVLSTIMAIAVSLPYLGEIQSFKYRDVLNQFTESKGSLHAFIILTVRAITKLTPWLAVDLSTFSRICEIGLWLGVATFAVRELARAVSASKTRPADVASQWTSILFAVIFVGSAQFYPWYIGMLFPLALLGVGTSALTDAIVLLSGTHMLGFTFVQQKSIGYFVLSTAVPLALLAWRRRQAVSGDIPLLALGLPVVKPGEGSIPSQVIRADNHGELLTS